MKLSFYGADRAVTGSCHCLDVGDSRVLVDCGLQQGRDEIEENALPFAAGGVDAVLVTHAHIDHSGRLPLLVKQGYTGPIFCSRLTAELLAIMLRDSAHIQESDAEFDNRKAQRAGRPMREPLYTMADAEAAIALLVKFEYGQEFEAAPGVRVRFADAGHLLGSSYAEVWATENGVTKKLVFSGDIGNVNQPVICNPTLIRDADLVVMESTYGDRNHDIVEFDHAARLAEVFDRTLGRGGNVIIPSFAVGRTQELLYFIREIKAQGLVHSVPNFPVYVDSPLAREATRIFAGDLTGYIDEEARDLVDDGIRLFTFDGLNLCTTSDESKALNLDPTPKVIISASGMCDAGRIRHHLKHNLWRADSSVVFVGYQAQGSLGRRILDGAAEVKLLGETIAVKAEILRFPGLSSHADHDHLLEWIHAFEPKPQHVFVVHGDTDVAPAFAEELGREGFSAHAPKYCEEYDLAAMRITAEGQEQIRKPKDGGFKDSPAFTALVELGRKLMDVIRRNRGVANRDLRLFGAEIQSLIDKWSR